MADKKQTSSQSDDQQCVKLSELVASKVKVRDDAGNTFYLDAVRPTGMFILRPIPRQEG